MHSPPAVTAPLEAAGEVEVVGKLWFVLEEAVTSCAGP